MMGVQNMFTMAWTFLKSALDFVLLGSYSHNEDNEHYLEEEENEIINQITNFKNLDTDHLDIDSCKDLLGCANQTGPVLETDYYLFKTGTVTFFNNYYGMIDDKIYFDVYCIKAGVLVNINDKVTYVTTDSSVSGEPARVIKAFILSNESWDSHCKKDWTTDHNSVVRFEAMHKVMNGKIAKLEERKFFVEPHNIWCNMNELHMSFEPIEGDWVSLEVTVTLNDEAINWEGEILEVLSVKPSMSQNGPGRVTFWLNGKNEGVINDSIVFDKNVCSDLYIPSLGDLVFYEAIESDQGKFKWRGISVKPDKLKLKKGSERRLFKNKKGIVITQTVSVLDLKLNETKEIIVEVINTADTDRTLLKTKILKMDKNSESQLNIKSPSLTDECTLKPSERLKFVVSCTGKNLGSTGELLEFHFKDFRIAKSFEINVLTDDCVEELSRLKIGRLVREGKVFRGITNRSDSNTVLYGRKPFTSHRFLRPSRTENFDIPKTLWRIMLGPADVPKSTSEAVSCLRKSLPYLSCGLSPETYVKRFRTLLHLEEMAIKIKFNEYSSSESIFQKKDDHWYLEVSGLAEGRPSILQGDKIIVTRPWLSKTTHIGYVHKVECYGVYVDFHLDFSNSYRGEKCDVRFTPNTGNFIKCHQAITKAFNLMGKDWLFPSNVIEKPDNVWFKVAGEPVKEKVLNKTNEERTRKTLIWNNKNLNERQKLAVVNVLRGTARPLPYIIFGPPGTGKTTTVVELIIQVSTLIPNSRVLVCGPSNSSVDLLTERLINSGLYKPGELVRLYAVSRSQLIPEKLAPYSECVKDELPDINETERKIKGSRVTLGTFSSIVSSPKLSAYEGNTFTHAFLDEVGQMTEPETMIPVCFLNKEKSQLVLAGDPKQLGPMCTSLVAANFDFEKSFLERLISSYPYKPDRNAFPDTSGYDPRLITVLTLNYRSLPEIINLPNQLFYDSNLVPLISDEDSFEAKLLKHLDIKVPKRKKNPAIIFHGVVGKNLQEKNNPSWYNPQEIWQVVVYLKKLYESGLSADDVGIVTPYNKQVQKCRSALTSVNLPVPDIGTVNRFQGQEKHVIILTTVRSCVEVLKKDMMFSLGFVASPRRLNVALTRARTLLIILGNPNLLKVDPYWEKVIGYCIQNNSYVGCNIKSTLKQNDINEQDEDFDSDDSNVSMYS